MDLKIIPLSVELKGKVFYHYPDGRNLNIKSFYQALRDKEVANTSLVNVGEFLDFFEPYLKQGKDILYIGFSSALSGTVQSAKIAAETLAEEYKDNKIVIVDSLYASMGLGLLIHYAYLQASEGKSIDEVASWVEAHKLQLCHLFTVDDLGTLKRGGRLSGTQALLGTLLKVKPVLHVTNDGKLVPIKKARGRRTSLETLVELMKERIVDPKNQTIFISHGDDEKDAKFTAELIQKEIGVKTIIFGMIGPVIGAHSGPGTIAVFFLGEPR
ncbi:DegV family protein [Mycoplasmatota bacterium]|nr:DegV family protein [Mycoplasmatota bacterium]